jgi:hypothetical protein
VIAFDRIDESTFCSTFEEIRHSCPWEYDASDPRSGTFTGVENSSPSVDNSDVYGKKYVSLQELEYFNEDQQQAVRDTISFDLGTSDLFMFDPDAFRQEQIPESLYLSRIELRDEIIKDDGASLRKKRSLPRPRASACKAWLQMHGPTSYPSKKQLKELALAEGKTTKQARIALNNLRARTKQGESAGCRKTGKSHANTRQTQAGNLLICRATCQPRTAVLHNMSRALLSTHRHHWYGQPSVRVG